MVIIPCKYVVYICVCMYPLIELLVYLCCVCACVFCMHVYIYIYIYVTIIVFSRLLTPLGQDEYGWTQSKATLYVNIILTVNSAIAIADLIGTRILVKW